ncbi:F-box/kelch-repeat protein At3g06240-like [Vicia villosa]|uniref:F-box/kelch-repeat protein At3g06240-like n=1 Tax=Vicia villosa TaxID=3911 RepID=UPI00273BF470|nr:F-box/kelch-repeat protein At3g06240-like [Vicia villosa]
MENSKSKDPISTEKVSNHVPSDLTMLIISKLPLKSLVRFRCIHKSWSLLFENPHFMNMYRINFVSNDNFSYDDDSCLTLEFTMSSHGLCTTLFSLYGYRFENKVKLDLSPLFQEDNECIKILGSPIDETICLYNGFQIPKIIFWNLSTKDFKVLPPSPIESQPPYYKFVFSLMGFGYDHVRDDHKVIRNAIEWTQFDFEDTQSNEFIWELYSLRNNSWRKLDVDISLGFVTLGSQFHTYGMCHWGDEDENCLVSFDLSSEVFFKTPLPLHRDDNVYYKFMDKRLMALNGSIAFITTYATRYGTTTHTLCISILGEYGVKKSWIKLFNVESLPSYFDRPIGAGSKGDIFFKTKYNELQSVSVSIDGKPFSLTLCKKCVHQFHSSGISSTQITESDSLEFVDSDELLLNDTFRDNDGVGEEYEDNIEEFSAHNSLNVRETMSCERKGDGAGTSCEVVNESLVSIIHFFITRILC